MAITAEQLQGGQVTQHSHTCADAPRISYSDLTNTPDYLDILFFGDGSDGTWSVSANYTMTRDMYPSDLIVDSSITLSPAGYRIFSNNSVTVNGVISRN